MPAEELVPLPRMTQRFLDAMGRQSPPYRRIHQLAIDGRIPAHFVGGRWYFQPADLPKIIEILASFTPCRALPIAA